MAFVHDAQIEEACRVPSETDRHAFIASCAPSIHRLKSVPPRRRSIASNKASSMLVHSGVKRSLRDCRHRGSPGAGVRALLIAERCVVAFSFIRESHWK